MLISGSDLETLHRHYGHALYRCPYAFCPEGRWAYMTEDGLAFHIRSHGKPLKCSVEGCLYHITGFRSEKARERHWESFHASRDGDAWPRDDDIDYTNITAQDVTPLLIRAAELGRQTSVQRILESPSGMQLQP
jgi:hypothetical protein